MTRSEQINLVLRSLMELGVVAGFGVWGYEMGQGLPMKIVLAVGVPLLGFGFWGAVDFHQLGSMAEPARLIQELVVSGLAALAFYMAGQPYLGWTLAGLSVVYHMLVYATGARLLKA
jgi:hypothetical protein